MVRVEGSDDLQQWRTLNAGTHVLRLTRDGRQLSQTRIVLDDSTRYLRLVPAQPGLPALEGAQLIHRVGFVNANAAFATANVGKYRRLACPRSAAYDNGYANHVHKANYCADNTVTVAVRLRHIERQFSIAFQTALRTIRSDSPDRSATAPIDDPDARAPICANRPVTRP